MPAQDLPALNHQRGTDETVFGELVNCLEPTLPSAVRSKSHYLGKAPQQSTACRKAFGHNEAAIPLLHALPYNLAQAGRRLQEKATRVLAQAIAKLWTRFWRKIQRLSPLLF